MVKNIRIVTHTDLDGASFPYILERLCEVYEKINGCEYEVQISYCDVNNVRQVINKDFERLNNLSEDELNNTFYLVLDIGNIGEPQKMIPQIIQLKSKGLNFSYIDHHNFDSIKKMVLELDNTLFITDNKMCASMIGFMCLLNCYLGNQIKDFENLYGILDPSGIAKPDRFLRNQRLLCESVLQNNTITQYDFYCRMFNIKSTDLNNEEIKHILSQSLSFIYGTDFLDRGKMSNRKESSVTKGYVEVIRDYLNLTAEHSNKDINYILQNIMDVLNSEKDSKVFEKTVDIIEDIKRNHHLEERIQESLNNAFFIKAGQRDKQKNFIVFFAQGDIRYNIEALRFKTEEIFRKLRIEPFRIDGAITFTRGTIGHGPIITIKPTVLRGNILKQVEDLFINKDEILGMDAGIGVDYDRHTYTKLSWCINRIVKGHNGVNHERENLKNIIMTKLREHFEFEEFVPSLGRDIKDYNVDALKYINL